VGCWQTRSRGASEQTSTAQIGALSLGLMIHSVRAASHLCAGCVGPFALWA
jgi:hypothetical protein